MNFRDIPQFTETPNFRVAVSLDRVVENLDDYVKRYNMEMEPEFQRGHVWTEEQQVYYIEYLLMGGNSGREIYFNMPNFNNLENLDRPMVLVDGLQRLTAIRKFTENKIRAFGLLYNEFDGNLPFRYCVFFNVNDLDDERDVLKWYLEMNSGGTVHTKEELDRVRALMESIVD